MWSAVMVPRSLVREVLNRDVMDDLRRFTAGEQIEGCTDDDRYRIFLGYLGRYVKAVELEDGLARLTGAYTWADAAAVLREHPQFATDAGEQLLAEEVEAAEARADHLLPRFTASIKTPWSCFGATESIRPWPSKRVPRRLGLSPNYACSSMRLTPCATIPPETRNAGCRCIEASRDADRPGPRSADVGQRPGETRQGEAGRIVSGPRRRLELAIAGYEAALAAWDPGPGNHEWANVQNSLGVAYSERMRGSRADNIERAIACYEAALGVFDRENEPEEWAEVQGNLAIAYRRRLRGDRSENSELALRDNLALGLYTEKSMALKRGMTLSNLGVVYLTRIQGDKQDNLDHAIRLFNEALSIIPLKGEVESCDNAAQPWRCVLSQPRRRRP